MILLLVTAILFIQAYPGPITTTILILSVVGILVLWMYFFWITYTYFVPILNPAIISYGNVGVIPDARNLNVNLYILDYRPYIVVIIEHADSEDVKQFIQNKKGIIIGILSPDEGKRPRDDAVTTWLTNPSCLSTCHPPSEAARLQLQNNMKPFLKNLI